MQSLFSADDVVILEHVDLIIMSRLLQEKQRLKFETGSYEWNKIIDGYRFRMNKILKSYFFLLKQIWMSRFPRGPGWGWKSIKSNWP